MFGWFRKNHIGPEYIIKEEFEHDRIRYQVYFNNKDNSGYRTGEFYKAKEPFSSYNKDDLIKYTEDFLFDLWISLKI